ncbi:hemerythrin domain-containing protein [Actinoplanes sp. NPDC051851]|uniref:hemerythrin domain-containing protein n=1 Tax=Actinoplanes sp. NPDC051851 TaxID=3154753 RepID=UPI003430F0CE
MRSIAVPGTTTPYTQEMLMIHRVFRREAAQLLHFVTTTGAGDVSRARQVAEAVREYIGGLHHHHGVEDELIWPLLHARAQVHDDLVIRMEMQHEALDVTLTTLQGLLPRWEAIAGPADRDALAEALTDHRQVLLDHLGDEETLVMPLVEEHLTTVEWQEVGRRGLENVPRSKVFLALGAILEEATPEERREFLGRVPLAGRMLWRIVGRRRYQRQMAALRGGAV